MLQWSCQQGLSFLLASVVSRFTVVESWRVWLPRLAIFASNMPWFLAVEAKSLFETRGPLVLGEPLVLGRPLGASTAEGWFPSLVHWPGAECVDLHWLAVGPNCCICRGWLVLLIVGRSLSKKRGSFRTIHNAVETVGQAVRFFG